MLDNPIGTYVTIISICELLPSCFCVVGAKDGALLGTSVGEFVGGLLGTSVGAFVGDLLGTSVGVFVELLTTVLAG